MVRRREAETRLRDYGEDAASAAVPAAALLPAAGDALGQVAGRPAFLDPEATRPLARAIHRGRPVSCSPDSPVFYLSRARFPN